MDKTRKMVILSILIAQALCLHVIEGAIPVPIPVPGIKLGLANIITLFTIIVFGWREAFLVVILRTFMGALFGGGVSAFLFSIVGGLLSAGIMSVMYFKGREWFSLVTVSIVGAVSHNIGQILVASLIVSNMKLFYYLPVLMISGIVMGLMIGLIVLYTMKPLRKILRINL